MSSVQRDRLAPLALVAIIILALGLRVYRLDGQSLWADEGNSAALASRSLAQITRDSAQDIHPPLYYWVLHAWTRVAGTSEAGLRSLSVVLGTILVGLTYVASAALSDRTTALLASLFAAISPFLVYYAQETRMYMLLAVLSTALMVGLALLIAAEQTASLHGHRARAVAPTVIIVLAMAAGLYTHYSFPLVLIAANAVYVLRWIASFADSRPWPRLIRWLGLQLAALLLFAPWASTAIRQLRAWPQVTAPLSFAQSLRTALRHLLWGPDCAAVNNAIWLVPLGLLFALGCVPLAIRSRGAQHHRSSGHWSLGLMPIAWLLAPVLVMAALRLYKEAYLKFLIVSAPAACIILARGAIQIARMPRLRWNKAAPVRNTATAILLIAALVAYVVPAGHALFAYYLDPRCARDDYRGIAAYVDFVSTEQDAVLLNAPGQMEVWDFYNRSGLSVYALPRQRPPVPAQTISELEPIAAGHRYLYALLWATSESDPARVVESWLDQHAYKASDEWRGDVRFVTYAMERSETLTSALPEPDVLFGELLALRETRIADEALQPGEIAPVRLEWEAMGAIDRRYKVTLQLLDGRNQVLAQRDGEPAGEQRPTSGWSAGERIVDRHGLLVPLATPPGAYRLILAMYDREDQMRLPLPNGQDHLELGTIVVVRAKKSPPPGVLPMRYDQQHDFGPITLVGHDRFRRGYSHDPYVPLRPGDLLHLTLFWQADSAPKEDWSFALTLGQDGIGLTGPLVDDSYPTSQWDAGEIMRGDHDVPVPVHLAAGSYRLTLSLTVPHTGETTRSVSLGRIQVQSD